MLKHRIVPVLLYDGAYCVQTTRFARPSRKLGPIKQFVNNMANRNVDELIILDIEASRMMRAPNFNAVKIFTEDQFCPVAYGGGIHNIDDISTLIRDCGVDKIVINSNYSLIDKAANKFGSQAVVYAMDCTYSPIMKRFIVKGLPPKLLAHKWAKEIENSGAGEIILTDINCQGLMKGYGVELIKLIADEVNIPVVANGGCGEPSDMVKAIKAGASAVAASSMFALRGVTPQDCAEALQEAGLPARTGHVA